MKTATLPEPPGHPHVGADSGYGKETLIVVLAGSLLLILLIWPALHSYFFAENFQYLGQYRAHGNRFWPAVFSPTDNIFFRPVFFIFSLPWFHLLEPNPLPYHLRNFIFSVVNILLLHRVLVRLVKSPRARILALLLFVVSKVHFTTIGYINIFDSIVMLMLLLLTILFFLRYIARHNLMDYLLGMAFCTLSVFSKDYGLVSLVVVSALVLTYGLGADWSYQKAVWWAVRLSPLCIVVLIYLSLRYSLIGTIAGPPTFNPIYSPQFSFKIAVLKTLILTTSLGNLSLAPGGVTGAAGLGSWLTIKSDRIGAWFSTPQYGDVQVICVGDAFLYLALISLLVFTIIQARHCVRRFLFPLVWIVVYFAPTLLTRNFQMYYNYEPLAGIAILLGMCLDKSRKSLLYVWAAAIFLTGINGALSNYRSHYNWQHAAEAARKAHVPVVENHRGGKVDSITFVTEQRDFWAFTLGGYPMLAEMLGQPDLIVNYVPYEEAQAQLAKADANHLLFDIDNGFLEYPRQLQPLLIRSINPQQTKLGIGFQVQPNGQSALSLSTENASPGTVVMIGETRLPTTYGDPSFITALLPNEMLNREGRYAISITDRIRKSNKVDFLVQAGKGGDGAATENSETTTNPESGGENLPASGALASGRESVDKAARQVNALINNVKSWKEKGHRYRELNLKRALDDHLFPREMINQNGVAVNLWGGPVDIGPAPASMGDSFLIVFSGIPNEECIRLSFPLDNNYKVYAGTFIETSAPSSEAQARSLCLTGNMWFVAR